MVTCERLIKQFILEQIVSPQKPLSQFPVIEFISIIKRSTCLISRVRSISKWPPHWIYYDLNANISRKQPHFTYIRTYQLFVSLSHTAETVDTCIRCPDVRDHSTCKTRFSSSSFFLCFFLCFYVSFLSKTLIRGNSILRKAPRVSLE